VDSLEMASVKALNSIADFNKRHFVTKSEPGDENRQVSNQKPQVGTTPQGLSTKQAPVKSPQPH
jgi:hypothetical protein